MNKDDIWYNAASKDVKVNYKDFIPSKECIFPVLKLRICCFYIGGITLSTSVAQNLESMRAYGLQTSYILYVDPQHLSKPSIEIKLNTDLTVTLDINHINDAEQSLYAAWSYGVVDVWLSSPLSIPNLPSQTRFLEIEEGDLRNTGLGTHMRPDAAPHPYFTATAYAEDRGRFSKQTLDNLSHLQVMADHFGVAVETVVLAEAHRVFNRNVLVSDDPDMQKLRTWYGRARTHHIITSDELVPMLKRLQRRRGTYYTSAHNIVNSGLYYRRELLLRVPAFDAVWATAIYADDAGIDPTHELVVFVDSIGDRIKRLVELRDEIELRTEEEPNNDVEWDIVNRLNYFFMMVTGLMDNLAWVALARHSKLAEYLQPTKRNGVCLQLRDKNGSVETKPFNKVLKQLDQRLYDHILNHQDLIAVFYPVRDSVQHRTVLSGTRVNYLDRDWVSAMVHIDPVTQAAMEALEPAQPFDVNTWGLFQFQDLVLIEPDAFSRQALDHVVKFTQTFLQLLDMPALLTMHPELKSIVDQPSEEIRKLIER